MRFSRETTSAIFLLIAAMAALILCNSPWHYYYSKILQTEYSFSLNNLIFKTNLKFFINDGLMTFFFLIVAREIKYEVLYGHLNSTSKALLPVITAIGGMIVPALIYVGLNYHSTANLRGWAIPTATDIAFAFGTLSLLGNRIPPALKTFLLALAIIDDLIAILIIALFYGQHSSFLFLALALFCSILLIILNFKKINHLFFYCLLGILLWLCLVPAGVHPTLAGVVLAFLTPMPHAAPQSSALFKKFRSSFHFNVTFVILPLFAFANAGIDFLTLSFSSLNFSVIVGIILSLFLGKQLGIMSSAWLAIKLRYTQLPLNVTWLKFYGVAVLCGIGFTISLFIGILAFTASSAAYLTSVTIGILAGSLISGILGYLLLFLTNQRAAI